MLTLNQTPGYDNQVIWFYKCYLNNGNIIYLTDNDIQVSYSSTGGNTYDGNSLQQNSNVIDKFFDFTNGGDIGTIANITLSITKNSNNALLNDFHNEFYPNTTNYLINTRWEIGIGWDNMPNESRITWLYEFYTHDIVFNYDKIDLELYSYDFYNLELPKYIAQKENDKLNYYYENLDEDNVGLPLPLLYGNMAIYFEYNNNSIIENYYPKQLAYTICVDKKLSTYLYATHKCKETIADITFLNAAGNPKNVALFNYIDSAKAYLEMTPTEGIVVNNHGNSYIQMTTDDDTIDQFIYGSILINNFRKGSVSDYVNINLFSEYYRLGNKFLEIEYNKQASAIINDGINNNDIGLLSSVNNSHILLRVFAESGDGTNVTMRVLRYNNNLQAYSTDYNDFIVSGYDSFDFEFATQNSAKNNSDLPYTMDDFSCTEFVIKNLTTNKILKVRTIQLIMENILISEIPHTANDYYEYYNRQFNEYLDNGQR